MMLLWLRRCLAGCAVGALAVLPATRYPAQPVAPGTSASWAMPGHDPQRTAQSTGVGPQRATPPHLVLKGLTSDPPIIGPDGTLYGFLSSAAWDRRLAAVSPAGSVLWSTSARPPTWAVEGESYPVLAPDGRVFFTGGACTLSAQRAAALVTPQCLTVVGPDGRVRWHAVTQYLTKSLARLLVRPDGALVRATVGPSGFPMTVYAPTGVSHPLGTACSWAATAFGGHRLYAATEGSAARLGDCRAYSAPQDQDRSSVVALTASGARVWATPLPVGCAASTLTVDPQRGEIYVAALCGRHGERGHTRIFGVNARGHLLWMTEGDRSDGQPALALNRASGDVWVADTAGLRRISPAGVTRWQRTWRATFAYKMTLVLDARDTAFVCGADGLLRAINPDGRVLWQYRFIAPRYGFGAYPPSAALGPDGKLYVSSDSEPGIVVFAP